MATNTDDFNALTFYSGKGDLANKKTMEFSTKIVSEIGPQGHETEYRPMKKPVEKITLAELLVNHGDEQRESISEIQPSNLNLVRAGNRTRLGRGRATSDVGYGDVNKPYHWISRFSLAVILLCFLGLFLFSYRLQNYSNELRLAVLSLEERIGLNNLSPLDGLPAQNVLAEINEKYLLLEKKVLEIAKADISVKIPVIPLDGGIEKKNDVLYRSLENRLAALEQQLSEQSPETTTRVDPPVLLKKKSIERGTKQIDEPLTTEPAVSRRGWVVNLLSFKTMRSAEKLRNQFAKKGIRTQLHPVDINGNRWYRLRGVGFPTRRKAVEFGDVAKSTLGLDTYWLGRALSEGLR